MQNKSRGFFLAQNETRKEKIEGDALVSGLMQNLQVDEKKYKPSKIQETEDFRLKEVKRLSREEEYNMEYSASQSKSPTQSYRPEDELLKEKRI